MDSDWACARVVGRDTAAVFKGRMFGLMKSCPRRTSLLHRPQCQRLGHGHTHSSLVGPHGHLVQSRPEATTAT